MSEPREIRELDSPKAVIETAARMFIDAAKTAIATRGFFSVALAGGSTPRELYARLAQSPLRESIDWAKVHFFLGDERAVAPNDERSNSLMARTELIDRVAVNPSHVHLPNGSAVDLEGEAARYEAKLRSLDGPLDLVLLGMGPDGHTASLFPHSPALEETERLFVATPVATREPFVRRLTLTFVAINAARSVLFLVTGEDKADVIAACLDETKALDITDIPARGVHPQGQLTFLLDKKASQNLSL